MSNIMFFCAPEEVPAELSSLLCEVSAGYPVSAGNCGTKKLSFRKIDSCETVSNVIQEDNGVVVEYTSVAAAARGIGSALSGISGRETSPFKTLGIMLDVSRGMVMTTEHLKKWFLQLALSGCNLVMLYTEDTYQLPGEPYFGRFRGAYSMEEIRDLDSYAQKVGIELIGCIQTLGHMEQALRWSCAYGSVSDTTQELLAEEEKTYGLIRKMIGFWSKALSSRRIHIGMDETQNLGCGKYLKQHGYKSPFEILSVHLNKVNAICREFGLDPMIWSDMYFRFANKEHEYYDWTSEIPQDVQDAIPKNLGLVYWDYYHGEESVYTNMIRRHREIGFEPIIGSGIWTWMTPWYNHTQTYKTVIPCISACRKENVKELFFTMWGDDGGYCNYDSSLMGIIYCTDLAYGGSFEDDTNTGKRFSAVCHGNYAAAKLVPDPVILGHINPMLMIWDDPLMGIYYDEIIKRCGEDVLNEAVQKCRTAVSDLTPFRAEKEAGDYDYLLDVLQLFIRKTELRKKFLAAYAQKDNSALQEMADTFIPELVELVKCFDQKFRFQWMSCAKPQGLERIQLRNAGLIARLQETACRIREYLSGETRSIPELEEPDTGDILSNAPGYGYIATGSVNRF